ncbi:Translocating chain-associated membrane protein 1 [Dirofilaria immitis]|nr:Translocating chain-associated membrane protein 1 [Dirofilaria immitis]
MVELRRSMGGRGKKTSPPFLSHEFIIQNHGDIMSCLLMGTSAFASIFIVPQYNDTFPLTLDSGMLCSIQNNEEIVDSGKRYWFFQNQVDPSIHAGLVPLNCSHGRCECIKEIIKNTHFAFKDRSQAQAYYRTGMKDIAAVAFYAIGWITIHAILQEYVLDKLQRKLHLSKTKMSKFAESGQLFVLHYILLYTAIAYWLHQFPEFYFQKYVSQNVFHLTRLFHFAEKWNIAGTGFKIWNIVFVLVRLASSVLAVLTLWYGFRSNETPYVDPQTVSDRFLNISKYVLNSSELENNNWLREVSDDISTATQRKVVVIRMFTISLFEWFIMRSGVAVIHAVELCFIPCAPLPREAQ